MTNTDRVEKEVALRAPRSRVWRAIADSREFGDWFQMKLDGPFKAGATVRGRILVAPYDHLTVEMFIERKRPPVRKVCERVGWDGRSGQAAAPLVAPEPGPGARREQHRAQRSGFGIVRHPSPGWVDWASCRAR